MQKTITTLGGKLIYVNIEQPYNPENETCPFPNWHVIYDLEKPAAKVEKITTQGDWQNDGHVLLHIYDAPPYPAQDMALHISGDDFLALYEREIGKDYTFTKGKVGRLYAELLAKHWAAMEQMEDKYLDIIADLEQQAAGDDF